MGNDLIKKYEKYVLKNDFQSFRKNFDENRVGHVELINLICNSNSRMRLLQFIFKCNFNVNKLDDQNRNLLAHLCENSQIDFESFKTIFDKTNKLDLVDIKGDSILHIYIRSNQVKTEIIQLFLQKNNKIDIKKEIKQLCKDEKISNQKIKNLIQLKFEIKVEEFDDQLRKFLSQNSLDKKEYNLQNFNALQIGKNQIL